MARGPCGDGERSAEDRLLPSSALPHLKQPPTFSVCLAPRCCLDLHPMSMRCTRCGARKGCCWHEPHESGARNKKAPARRTDKRAPKALSFQVLACRKPVGQGSLPSTRDFQGARLVANRRESRQRCTGATSMHAARK